MLVRLLVNMIQLFNLCANFHQRIEALSGVLENRCDIIAANVLHLLL